MIPGAQHTISEVVTAWNGISIASHRYGGTAYRVGKKEIGHIHDDRLVDIPFPRNVRDEIVNNGEAQPHHILPHTGWVSIFLENQSDVDTAIRLLRRSYDGLTAQKNDRRLL